MRYDLIVIGGGSAGLVAAKFAKGLGKKTALIEKNKIGGDCTHFGCVPSKTLLHIASLAEGAGKLKELGLTDGIKLNSAGAMKHVRRVISDVYQGSRPSVLREEGIDVIEGSPVFEDPHTVIVDGIRLQADKFILASGSSPLIPGIKGFDTIDLLTNENIFDLDELPQSVAVLGGGPIGIEMASALNALGVDTAVIEMSDRILPKDDRELSELLRAKLTEKGIKILTGTKVTSAAHSDGCVTLETEGSVDRVKAVRLLAAIGRRPNTEGLCLEKAGVEYTKSGVVTDKYLRTTAKNIYAAGDLVPPYQFSHAADMEAVTACRNALLPFRKAADYKGMGWCTFSAPELAGCGLTEEAAAERYGSDNVRIFRFDLKNLDRAVTDLEPYGMAKYITDRKGYLIGAHILGNCAGEILHEAMLAMKFRIPFQKISEMIHIYPTYSYAVRQPAKYAMIEMLMDHPLVKLFKRIRK